jgi:hypothetical protein
MDNKKPNNTIPTLSEVIQPGDESMQDHFDAHFFDNDKGIEAPDIHMDAATEKQEPFIGDDIEDAEQDEKIDRLIADAEKDPDLLLPVFNKEELKKTIDFIVSDAVQEIMPDIEQQLTREISQKIYQRVFSKK